MLSPDELLTTTRSVRKRLDLTRPVERSTVEECLRLAFQAPNGSNLQLYHWVLVDDPEVRQGLAEIYRLGMADQGVYMQESGEIAFYIDADDTDAQRRIGESAQYLVEHLSEVPVLVVPVIGRRMDDSSVFEQATHWGSVLPAVWNFMLALRSRGLGSAWTTVHLHREKETAALLGIPYDKVTQAGLFPVAYTIGTDFKPADRSVSMRHIHWNSW